MFRGATHGPGVPFYALVSEFRMDFAPLKGYKKK